MTARGWDVPLWLADRGENYRWFSFVCRCKPTVVCHCTFRVALRDLSEAIITEKQVAWGKYIIQSGKWLSWLAEACKRKGWKIRNNEAKSCVDTAVGTKSFTPEEALINQQSRHSLGRQCCTVCAPMWEQYLHEQSSHIGRDGGYGGPNSMDCPLTKTYLATLLLNGQSASNKD